MHIDIKPVQPMGDPRDVAGPAQRPVGRAFLRDLDLAKTLAELQDHIKGLTLGILDVQIEELPMKSQCHTIGVPGCWMRLLRMIA